MKKSVLILLVVFVGFILIAGCLAQDVVTEAGNAVKPLDSCSSTNTVRPFYCSATATPTTPVNITNSTST